MYFRKTFAIVVFLASSVVSMVRVYAQEDILIEPPLTWSINSIQIVWSVEQGEVKTQKAKFIYKVEQEKAETNSKVQTTEKKSTSDVSAGGGTRVDGSIWAGTNPDILGLFGRKTNPLNNFGLIGAKASASAYLDGGFNYNHTSNTNNTTLRSETEINDVNQTLSSEYNQLSRQKISNQRLVFTVDFVNHTDSQLEFDPRYTNGIPIFLGYTNIGKATPVGIKEAIISIPATGEPVPIEFEMPLDDSRKLTLSNDNRPLISINKGQLFFRTSAGEPEIEGNIFRKSVVATSYFTVAILSDNDVKEWKIRWDRENLVTLQDALEVINANIRDLCNDDSKTLFVMENDRLVNVCGVPFTDNDDSDWITQLKVFKGTDFQIVSEPDSCLTDTPRRGERYVFQLISKNVIKLEAEAKSGNAEAIFELANRYYLGADVPEDKVKAMELLHKAAELGCVESQFWLAWCYKNGEGVKQNYTDAVKWYCKAAELGHATAQNNLGACYYNGEGVEQDYKEAVKWFRKAAEQGLAEAQNWLGSCYYNGEGVEQNREEAEKWYRKAAEQGLASAQCNLAKCYNSNNSKIVSSTRPRREVAGSKYELYGAVIKYYQYEGEKMIEDMRKSLNTIVPYYFP